MGDETVASDVDMSAMSVPGSGAPSRIGPRLFPDDSSAMTMCGRARSAMHQRSRQSKKRARGKDGVLFRRQFGRGRKDSPTYGCNA